MVAALKYMCVLTVTYICTHPLSAYYLPLSSPWDHPCIVHSLPCTCMHACMHAYCTGASNGRPPVIGYTAYRFTYSTWEGRVVHVEDLFVEEQYRGEEVIRKCLLGHV